MTSTIPHGRLCNQLFRNIVVSQFAEKFDLSVTYSSHAEISSLGIKLFVGNTVHTNWINLTDDTCHEMYARDTLDANLNPNESFFQTRECSRWIYDLLRSDPMKTSIVSANPFKSRYDTNNDLFVHIRLGDMEHNNPGIDYYRTAISSISFDKLYLASDSPDHWFIQELQTIWPDSSLVALDSV